MIQCPTNVYIILIAILLKLLNNIIIIYIPMCPMYMYIYCHTTIILQYCNTVLAYLVEVRIYQYYNIITVSAALPLTKNVCGPTDIITNLNLHNIKL